MENTKQARTVASMRREIDYLLNRLDELPLDIFPAQPVHYVDEAAERRLTALDALDATRTESASPSRRHTVKAGESLFSISRQYGVHVQELQRHNQISDPTKLLAGNVLLIPSAGPGNNPGVSTSPLSQRNESGISSTRGTRSHTARKGETFWSIARKHGITVAELLRVNGLVDGAVLREGQPLRLPSVESRISATGPDRAGTLARSPSSESSTGYVYYEARPGDSFESVAARRGISVSQLRADNPRLARHQILRAGEVLVVPELGYRGGSPTVSKSEPSSTNPVQRERYFGYATSGGESMADVARSFGIPLESLRAVNDLPPQRSLPEGTMLNVPTASAGN